MKKRVANWGNYPVIEADVRSFSSEDELAAAILDKSGVIPRGLGRCYGDSSLAENIISTLRFNRMISFDEDGGLLFCESGVSLKEILDVFVPRGWFLPVTPGTKFVTVGGAIASNVHGKNHHKVGSFSNFVEYVDLMLPEGDIKRCSREENHDLFRATCGGMGLTGVILRAAFRLKKIETAYIRQETLRAGGIEEIMSMFEGSGEWTYSVAWIDCLATGPKLGRSIMMRGESAARGEIPPSKTPLTLPRKLKLDVPLNLPSFLLNNHTVRAFNQLYYSSKSRATVSMPDYDSFFYPLDGIHNWNRIYGGRGFTQYQFVIPKTEAKKGLAAVLEKTSNEGRGSFLAVLKLFGKEEGNLISFPMEGYTLALDFPISRGIFKFLDELDKLVLDAGGRLYLAKDSRMSEKTFIKSYKGSLDFMDIKKRIDKESRFRSLQSERLGI